jgi:hypothetical protein
LNLSHTHSSGLTSAALRSFEGTGEMQKRRAVPASFSPFQTAVGPAAPSTLSSIVMLHHPSSEQGHALEVL